MAGAEQTDTSVTLSTADVGRAEFAVLGALTQNAILPVKLEVLEPNIESLFMEVVK